MRRRVTMSATTPSNRQRRPRPAAGAPGRHRDPRPASPASCSPASRRLSPTASAPSSRSSSRPPAAASLVDVDGNSLIDLGAGIAVVNVGNAAPTVVDGIQEQVAAVHPHLLHGHAVRGLRRRRRAAQPPHAGRPRQEDRALQLRRRGGRERRQDRPVRHRPPGRRRLRARLPRPHQPDDGADRQVDAVQVRLRTVRRRDLPGAAVLPVPLADRAGERRPRGAASRPSARSRRRSAPTRSPRS